MFLDKERKMNYFTKQITTVDNFDLHNSDFIECKSILSIAKWYMFLVHIDISVEEDIFEEIRQKNYDEMKQVEGCVLLGNALFRLRTFLSRFNYFDLNPFHKKFIDTLLDVTKELHWALINME